MEGVAPRFRCTVPIMNERFIFAKSMNEAAIFIKAAASLHAMAKDAFAVQIAKMNHIALLEHLPVASQNSPGQGFQVCSGKGALAGRSNSSVWLVDQRR